MTTLPPAPPVPRQSQPPLASASALTRINGFAGLLWFVGIFAAIIAIAAAGARVSDFLDGPDAPLPLATQGGTEAVATSTDTDGDGVADVWSGRGPSILELPPELQNRPLSAQLLSGVGEATLTINDTVIDPDGFAYRAGTLYLDSVAPITIATYENSRLGVEVDGDWSLSLTADTLTPVADPVASGTGSARVLVPSDWSWATITAEGDGILWVDVLSIAGEYFALTEDVANSPVSFDWDSSPYVVLLISVDDSTEWTLEILEEAP